MAFSMIQSLGFSHMIMKHCCAKPSVYMHLSLGEGAGNHKVHYNSAYVVELHTIT